MISDDRNDNDNGGYLGSSPSSPPGLWLGLSIASTVCFGVPLGIVGIVYSALAINARRRGATRDVDSYVSTARGWTIASIVCGLIGLVIWLVLQ